MTSRFTDIELLAITQVASPWIRSGLWLGLEREFTPIWDSIIILLAQPHAHYRIERDATTRTFLIYCPDACDHVLAMGTLDECLAMFRLPEPE